MMALSVQLREAKRKGAGEESLPFGHGEAQNERFRRALRPWLPARHPPDPAVPCHLTTADRPTRVP